MRSRALHVVVLLACLVGAVATSAARPKVKAPESVDAELITVMATKEKGKLHAKAGKAAGPGGVDPKLGRQPALGKPPFTAWDTFTIVRRSGAVLAKGMAWKTKLPSGYELMIGLKDIIVAKKGDQPMKFVLTARLAKPGSTVTEPVLETTTVAGETIFVPTPKYQNGILVVGVKIIDPTKPAAHHK